MFILDIDFADAKRLEIRVICELWSLTLMANGKNLQSEKFISVADPDPNPDPDSPDPHVFGPPGSGSESTSQRYGSGSGYHHAKIVRKNLIPIFFVTLLDFLSLKNDVNVASKSNKQKKLC